jgi:hypothetical protein
MFSEIVYFQADETANLSNISAVDYLAPDNDHFHLQVFQLMRLYFSRIGIQYYQIILPRTSTAFARGSVSSMLRTRALFSSKHSFFMMESTVFQEFPIFQPCSCMHTWGRS